MYSVSRITNLYIYSKDYFFNQFLSVIWIRAIILPRRNYLSYEGSRAHSQSLWQSGSPPSQWNESVPESCSIVGHRWSSQTQDRIFPRPQRTQLAVWCSDGLGNGEMFRLP